MLCAWAALLSSVNIWTLAVLWLLSCRSCHMEFHKLLFSCLTSRSLFLFLFLCCPWYTIFYTEPSGGYSFTIIGLKRTLVLERNSRGIMSSYTHMTRQWQFLCTYQRINILQLHTLLMRCKLRDCWMHPQCNELERSNITFI